MADGPGGKEVGRLSLKVLPDTSEFTERLKAFAERIEEQVKVELQVELDNDQAVREIAALQARMEAADLNLEVDVDLDAAGALARLDLTLAAMQGTADLNPINVDVELDTLGAQARLAATTAAMQTTSSGAGSVGRQIALWGPLIFIAAVGIAAIGPALAVIAPLMAGMAISAGAIFLGFDQLKDLFAPLVKDFKDMRAEIGGVLTVGLAPLITALQSQFMPLLTDALTIFAQLFNQGLASLLGFLSSSNGFLAMAGLVDGLAAAFEPFADLIGPLAEVFIRLSTAALPALQMMGDALLRVTTQFADFLESGGATDTITQSMADFGAILSSIGSFGADIFPTLFAAAPAVIAFLDGMLSSIGGLFALMQPFFSFLSEHTGTMGLLGSVLGIVAVGIAVVTAATAAWNLVLAVNPIALLVIAIAALIAGLVYAYTHFEGFRKVVDTVWSAVKSVVSVAIAAIVAYVRTGIAIVSAVISGVRSTIAFLGSAFVSAKDAVVSALSLVTTKIGDLPGKILSAVSGLGSLLVGTGKKLIQGFIDGIGAMFGKVKDKLGDLTGKLTSWKGPESLDRVILFGAGQLVIQGFLNGLESEYDNVHDSLAAFTDDLTNVASDATISPNFASGTNRMLSAVDANQQAGPNGGAQVQVDVHPQPGQTEEEIGDAAANRILWVLAA